MLNLPVGSSFLNSRDAKDGLSPLKFHATAHHFAASSRTFGLQIQDLEALCRGAHHRTPQRDLCGSSEKGRGDRRQRYHSTGLPYTSP